MLLILYMLLILRVGRCAEEQFFEKKTIHVGDDVNLTCDRRTTGSLFWIRLVSGNFPEILAKTYSLETVHPHITATKEPGTFVLRITKAKLSDTAVYICLKTQQQSVLFLKGADLRVQALEPHVTAVPPSDPVCPGDSLILQCSVSESENNTRPEENSVRCFKTESYQSHPSFNCTQENTFGENENNPEGFSAKKCVFSFFKNMSCSGAGTYCCSVATCGDLISENKSKLNNEAVSVWDSQRNKTILFLLCVLATSLFVIALLISFIKAQDSRNDTATGDGQQNEHLLRHEDIWTYSTVVFTMMKTRNIGTSGANAAEREMIHDAVKASDLN